MLWGDEVSYAFSSPISRRADDVLPARLLSLSVSLRTRLRLMPPVCVRGRGRSSTLS
jgi:hypothetical protein